MLFVSVEISCVCRVKMSCCLQRFVVFSDYLEIAFVVHIVGLVILYMCRIRQVSACVPILFVG